MFHLHSCFTILVIISRFICYLSLRSDSVDESSGFNFCECPSFCLCTAEEIDCSAQQLIEIPIEIIACDWPTVLTLNLNDNFIRSINASDFAGFPSLTSLLLVRNQISQINRDAFTGLSSLRLLSLDDNQLSRLDALTFLPLQNLRTLYLHTNKISVIDANAFSGLHSLTLLALDDNLLSELDVNVFQPLYNLQRLLLYTNQITFLPVGIFKNLTSLTILALHDNRLSYLHDGLFDDVSNIQRLYLHDNQIFDVSVAPFRSLDKLLLLYLSGNALRSLTNSSLTGLNRLHTLVLSNNQISEISDSAFSHTPVLQELYMDNNLMEEITRNTFAPIFNLRVLRMGNNNLHSIEDGAFLRQPYLFQLYLHENQLQSITENTFAGLFGISELALYSNSISAIPANGFRNSIFLDRLWLQENEIECISEESFNGLGNLELLHLANNKIYYLPNDIFQYTPNLKYIILSSNNLTEIRTRPFRNLPSLIQLAIYYNFITYIAEDGFQGTENIFFLQWNVQIDFSIDNALQCDCSAMWLKDYLLINQPYYQSVLCGGPDDDDFRGSYLLSAPLEEKNCSRDMTVTVIPSSDQVYVKNGGCLRLKCETNRDADITWSKVEGEMRSSAHDDCEIKEDQCGYKDTKGLLTVSHFTAEDEGNYQCTVTHGNVTLRSIRQVLLGEPPVLVQLPIDQVFRDPPPYVLFNLKVSGNPTPDIQWYHNNKEMFFSDERYQLTQTGSLIVLDTIIIDNGTYTVIASNGAGSVEATAQLLIHYASPCYGTGCFNNGTCVPYYICLCTSGYSGPTCQDSTDDVTSEPITQPPELEDYSGDYFGDEYDKRKKRGVSHMYDDVFELQNSVQKKRLKKKHRIITRDGSSNIGTEKHDQIVETSNSDSNLQSLFEGQSSDIPANENLVINVFEVPKFNPPMIDEKELKKEVD